MRVSQRPVADLEPSPGNPRRHDGRGLQAIADSIRRWGFLQPLVVRGAQVVIGHGRLEAARRLDLQTVPVVALDDLTPDEARALRLADNRIGEISAWDPALLAADLTALESDARIGWSERELDELIGEIQDADVPLSGVETAAPTETAPETGEDGLYAANGSGDDDGGAEADEGGTAPDTPPPPRKGPMPELRACFPYSGGKAAWAAEINARLGADLQTYSEPFFGSGAILLSRPPARREVACDVYSLVTNAWRAMAAAPDECAYWADFPTHHDELVARRVWLGRWAAEHGAQVAEDVDYYDARAGGYWVWVQSQSVGGASDGIIDPGVLNARPGVLLGGSGGNGVQAQKARNRDTSIPLASAGHEGQGIQAQRVRAAADAGGLPSSERWSGWFNALARRLKRVVILNRSWESGVTPAVLGEAGGGEIGIMMDPPYTTAGRSTGVYASDIAPDASIDRVAAESHAWAVEHGGRYRIAYAHSLGSFQFPAGWTLRARGYTGGGAKAGRRLDAVAFSPRCLDA